jgi:hypothetical protein
METELLLAQASEHPEAAGLVGQAQNKLAEADSAYSRMEYVKAIQSVLAARDLARQVSPKPVLPQEVIGHLEDSLNKTRSELAEARSLLPLYPVAGLGVGLVIAMAVFLVMRRKVAFSKKPAETRTGNRVARYCASCGNEIMQYDAYCEHCGAKQM